MKTCVICKETSHSWTIAVQPDKRGSVINLLDALDYIEEACKTKDTSTYIHLVFALIVDDEDRDAMIKLLETHLEGEVEFVEKVDHTKRLLDMVSALKEND